MMYLIGQDWLFLLVALVAGIVWGWVTSENRAD